MARYFQIAYFVDQELNPEGFQFTMKQQILTLRCWNQQMFSNFPLKRPKQLIDDQNYCWLFFWTGFWNAIWYLWWLSLFLVFKATSSRATKLQVHCSKKQWKFLICQEENLWKSWHYILNITCYNIQLNYSS